MSNHKIDVLRLVAIGRQISKELAKLSAEEEWEKLIVEWRRPGWTTPAEFILVAGVLNSMSAQVRTLAKLKSELLKGSKAVTGQ